MEQSVNIILKFERNGRNPLQAGLIAQYFFRRCCGDIGDIIFGQIISLIAILRIFLL